jgi:hypothetical protein
MTQWDYKVVELPSDMTQKPQAIEALLRRLGQDGWELASTPSTGGGIVWYLYLKRLA